MKRYLLFIVITLFSLSLYPGCDTGNGMSDDLSGEVDGRNSITGLVSSADRNMVVLVPGWAGSAHIMFNLDYFWKIREPLQAAGFETGVVPVSCFAAHSQRARELAAFLYLKIRTRMDAMVARGLADDIAQIDPRSLKFNLICHSQGGIVARYLIKSMDIPDPRCAIPGIDVTTLSSENHDDLVKLAAFMTDNIGIDDDGTAEGTAQDAGLSLIPASDLVDSIAMISTPNLGTYLAEWIVSDAPDFIIAIAPAVADYLWAGFANKQEESDFTAATSQMTRAYMEEYFNPVLQEEGRDTSRIKVFIYAGEFREGGFFVTYPKFIPSFNYAVTSILWQIIYPEDGSNDGVVPSESSLWMPAYNAKNCQWKSMGIIPSKYGVDHWMAINHFLDLADTGLAYDATPGFDAPGFYVKVAGLLREQESGM